MCLIDITSTPHNKSRKRWKVLTGTDNQLSSVHQSATKWKVGKKQIAKCTRTGAQYHDIGFHVLLNKAVASRLADTYMINDNCDGVVVVELEVSGFNAAGIWSWSPMGRDENSETWRQAKITRVFTPSGRHDITHRYS